MLALFSHLYISLLALVIERFYTKDSAKPVCFMYKTKHYSLVGSPGGKKNLSMKEENQRENTAGSTMISLLPGGQQQYYAGRAVLISESTQQQKSRRV